MLKHIVLFKLKENAEGATKEENFRKIKKELESLKGIIPQIIKIEVGLNVIPSETAYDVAIYSEFADEKNLDIYMKHPEHVRIAGFIAKVRDSRVVVDYKTD